MAFSSSQTFEVASGFTVYDSWATRNGIVTSITIIVTATVDVTRLQTTLGTIKQVVRPKMSTSCVAPLTGGNNPRFVAIDLATNGNVSVTAQNPKDGVYIQQGSTIWIRCMYMSS